MFTRESRTREVPVTAEQRRAGTTWAAVVEDRRVLRIPLGRWRKRKPVIPTRMPRQGHDALPFQHPRVDEEPAVEALSAVRGVD